MKKRILSYILTISMALSGMLMAGPVTAYAAASGNWTDAANVAAAYADGDGSSDDPYQIATAGQLALLAQKTATNADEADGHPYSTNKYFILTADIDLADHYWVPIGYFYGHLDGQNYKISNLTIDTSSNYQGLIGIAQAGVTVSNINITGCTITTTGVGAGALIGDADGTGSSKVTISHCTSSGTVKASQTVGGVVGYAVYINISECSSSCTITATIHPNSSTDARAGGLIGMIWQSSGNVVSGCSATGSVTGSANLGGLIGCFAAGNPSHTLLIENSYATGWVATTRENMTPSGWGGCYLGGLIGAAGYQPQINNSYTTSILYIWRNDYPGMWSGVVGWQDHGVPGSVTNTYFNAVNSNSSNPDGQNSATPLPVTSVAGADMLDATFVDTLNGSQDPAPWAVDEHSKNGGFPVLKWQWVPDVSPTATTSAITATGATCSGIIVDNGYDILERGVVYSTSPDPDVTDSSDIQAIAAGTTGAFSKGIYGLQPDTKYYYRIFATNSLGTAYSAEKSFMTTAVSAAITSSAVLIETGLDTASLDVTLTNTTFNPTLNKSGFNLNNAPSGLTIESVTRVDDTHCTVALAFNGTDFDTGYPNFSLTIAGTQILEGVSVTSNKLTIRPIIEGIPNTGLVAYYPFKGNADDTSGNGNDGTAHGATLIQDRFGTASSAYLFDGTNDYIDKTSPSAIPTGNAPRTIAAWIKNQGATSGDKFQTIVGYGYGYDTPPSNGQAFALERGRDTSPYNGALYVTGWNNDTYGAITLPSNSWTHVAVTFDGTTTTLYVNGAADGSSAKTYNTVMNASGLMIGVSPPNDTWHEYFNGAIDDVCIYDRALSASEIQSLADDTLHAPTLQSAATNTAGNQITLTFSKAMADPAGKHGQFKVTSGGIAVSVTGAALVSGNTSAICLMLASPVSYGNTSTLGYTPGTVAAADAGLLATIAGITVTNNTIAYNTVTFNKNGGSTEATPASITVTSGSSVGTLPTAPLRSGYTFTGWNTMTTGGGITFTTSTSVPASITVYAQWSLNSGPAPILQSAATNTAGNQITLTFNKAMDDPTEKHGQFKVTSGGIAVSVTGAALVSGNTSAICLTLATQVSYGNTITLGYTPGTVAAADAGLLASVSGMAVTNSTAPTVYTVTFNKNGGSTEASPASITVTSGSSVGTLPTAPARSNYNFTSWNTMTTGGGITFNSSTSVTASITVYAQWGVITDDDDHGGGGGSSVKPPAAPVKVTTEKSDQATINKTEIPAVNSSGKVSASISSEVFDAILSKAASTNGAGQGDTLELNIDTPKNAQSLQATFAQNDLEKVVSRTDASLALSSPFITVSFDAKALETISGAGGGGSVVISASKVDVSALSDADREKVSGRPVYDLSVKSGGNQVSDFEGGLASVTIPYTLGQDEDPSAVVVFYLANDGSLQAAQGYYNMELKSVVCKTPHFSKFVVSYNPVEFSDVSSGAWYADAVEFLAARGITTGAKSGGFLPGQSITRAQFLVMLMRAYSISPETSSANNFSDAGNTYYTGYLASAKTLGITEGIGSNKFAPDRKITRQEMSVMLCNALQAIDQLPQARSGKTLSDFEDTSSLPSWAENAMTLLVSADVMTGSGDKLRPAATATRAEMAQLLYNLLTR